MVVSRREALEMSPAVGAEKSLCRVTDLTISVKSAIQKAVRSLETATRRVGLRDI